MAGTIPLSLTQQLDEFGEPLAGGKLYLIQAGTTSTPQNGFQDSALTLAWPNPIVLDAAGRLPQFFLADGSIKVRLTDVNGVEKLVADGIIVTGASSGGGGGSPVDPTTVLQTGWLQPIYGTGVVAGFVRANGRTIGSATSSATERAFADTQPLFVFLYGQDPNLVVSGGRTGNAAADYAANKTITLPDWRGRALAFLDDMGNTAAARLTTSFFGATATVLGAAGGTESHTLTLGEAPAGITTSGVNSINVANASQTINVANASQTINVANATQTINVANASQAINVSGVNSITASNASQTINVMSSDAINLASAGPSDNFTSTAGSGQWDNITRRQISSSGVNNITVSNPSQTINASGANSITATGVNNITASGVNNISASGVNNISASGSNTITAASTNTGGAAHAIVQPTMLATIYIKL